MQIFSCPACARPLYFHNLGCICGQAVAFDPLQQVFLSATQSCANRQSADCNWVARPDGSACLSCAMTRTIPDLTLPENETYWRATEMAKRWVLAGLLRLGWFTPDDPGPRPTFDLIAEDTASGTVKVTMGHADGLITLNVSEADPARLAARQVKLDERYRSLVGHLRHEIAHFLHWRLMVETPGFAEDFRNLFGDERADYAEALKAHYAHPKPADSNYITSYATAHPHEDWAETAANLQHLLDITDSFAATNLALPHGGTVPDAYGPAWSEQMIEAAGEIGLALNHVNRSMGLSDLYPFVLPDGVRMKLGFVHRALRR